MMAVEVSCQEPIVGGFCNCIASKFEVWHDFRGDVRGVDRVIYIREKEMDGTKVDRYSEEKFR